MTHEKIFKILLSTTLALILVILGVGYVFYYKYLDQVTLQHDNEQISKYKRSLDYSSFGIDDFFNRYQGIPDNSREWWGVREAKGVYLGRYKLSIIHLSK